VNFRRPERHAKTLAITFPSIRDVYGVAAVTRDRKSAETNLHAKYAGA
jgi:hypothetical protein